MVSGALVLVAVFHFDGILGLVNVGLAHVKLFNLELGQHFGHGFFDLG